MADDRLPRGERTRSDILDAAYRLFLERGFHGTSMRRIANEAHVALGGIYNHFSGKEEIFLAVLLERHPYLDVLQALKDSRGETLEDLVRDAARRMVGKLDNRKDFLNLMFVELVEFNGQHLPAFFSRFFPQVMEFAGRFQEKEQELRPIPAPILMRAFLGLFVSHQITELLIEQDYPSEIKENSLDYFVDIYLHGILKG